MDPVLQNLLLLYAGLVLINVTLSAVLWAKNRTPLFRALFFVWASTLFSLVFQGVLQHSSLLLVLGYASVFAVNFSLALLLGHSVDVDVRIRPFIILLGAGLLASAVAASLGAPFWTIALPTCVGVCAPAGVTATRVARHRWAKLTVAGKVLTVSTLVFVAHNLDYAFLRDRPALATVGFSVAILIVFALSITGPAVALEIIVDRQARIATELEAARRIQRMIVPRELALPGLEVVGFIRTADSVGGDYFDVHRTGDDSWLLLGDVTGHGLGAGLVMLMAQSTLSAILRARPDISPRELNHLANVVLVSNLARLEERRHMTIVSMRCDGMRFVVSGSHDDMYLWRARTRSVEAIPVDHFPWGIGMTDLAPDDVGEDDIRLERGDVLFVGTDGVVEAARGGDPRLGLFGEDAVREILTAHATAPLDSIKEHMIARLDGFTCGVYHDDVAFLLVRAREGAS